MGKTYKTEYGIGLRDEASATIGNIQTKIRDLNKSLKDVEIGSKTFNDLKRELVSTEGALSKAKEGIGRYGQEQNKLKDFIREQRTEQRQQTFMFNQLKDVAGTAAIGLSLLGNVGGESMKKLSSSLNQGFIAFQGLDFLLRGIPGPWGMAISVIGGAASAIFSFSQETSKAKDELAKLDVQLINILFRMGEVSKEAKITILEQQIASAQLKLLDLNKVTIEWVATMKEAALGQIGVVWRGVGTPAEVKQAEIALASAREELKKFFDELAKGPKQKLAKTPIDTGLIIMEEFVIKADRILPRTVKHAKELKAAMGSISNVELANMKTGFEGLVAEEVKGIEYIVAFQDAAQSGFAAVGQAIDSGFRQQFEKVFGEANSLLEIFIENFMSQLVNIAASEVFKFALNFISGGAGSIFSLFGFHQGGTVPKAHDGMYIDAPPTQTIPILARGGETIRTEQQEKNLRSSGLTINVYNYGPISDEECFKRIVESGMRKAGVTSPVDYFRNSRGNLALT